jgi:hypothetical protein
VEVFYTEPALKILLKDIDRFELHFCSELQSMDVLAFNRASGAILNGRDQISDTPVLDPLFHHLP